MAQSNGKLPMRGIVIAISVVFCVLVGLFLMLPAFFDVHITDALFETPEQPWMLPPEVQAQYNFSVTEMQGKYHYGQYCQSCHGEFGAGGGPQAARVGGVPNLISAQTQWVHGSDRKGLERTLEMGVPGSAMPAFPHLAKHVRETILDYLEYLIRHRDRLSSPSERPVPSAPAPSP